MKTLSLLLAAIIFSNITFSQEGKLNIDTNKIAIIYFKNEKTTRLTNRDIKIIDSLLNDCFTKYNKQTDTQKDSKWLIHFEKYKMQYAPIINKDGKRIVWISCQCSMPEGWKQKFYHVDDGGICNLGLKVNLSDKLYYDFSVGSESP